MLWAIHNFRNEIWIPNNVWSGWVGQKAVGSKNHSINVHTPVSVTHYQLGRHKQETGQATSAELEENEVDRKRGGREHVETDCRVYIVYRTRAVPG